VRGYQHVVAWYCSEPRLAFNKTVILRYRFHLEERGLAPGTINVRMGAVRRLAYEAADSGLLSPESADGVHRVKGVRDGNADGSGNADGNSNADCRSNESLPAAHHVNRNRRVPEPSPKK
jgi:hypothetical protein